MQKETKLEAKSFGLLSIHFYQKGDFLENKDIAVIEGKKIKTSKKDLIKTFNEHYINIVKEAVD